MVDKYDNELTQIDTMNGLPVFKLKNYWGAWDSDEKYTKSKMYYIDYGTYRVKYKSKVPGAFSENLWKGKDYDVISKDEFLKFEEIRSCGKYDMVMDSGEIIIKMKITPKQYFYIIEHYNELANKFLKEV